MRKYSIKKGELKAYRVTRGMNQTEFWGAIGLTQSAGSRYERGDRAVPALVIAEIIRVHLHADNSVPIVLKESLPRLRRQIKMAARMVSPARKRKA